MTSSWAGWEAQVKGALMGDVYVRCPDCDQLSFDPRTELCLERHVDESWEWRDNYEDTAA